MCTAINLTGATIFTVGALFVAMILYLYVDTLRYIIKNAPPMVKTHSAFILSVYPVSGRRPNSAHNVTHLTVFLVTRCTRRRLRETFIRWGFLRPVVFISHTEKQFENTPRTVAPHPPPYPKKTSLLYSQSRDSNDFSVEKHTYLDRWWLSRIFVA